MCGIAGIVDHRGQIAAETVVRMRDTLIHRGPDDMGLWMAPSGMAGLGHRRLSILDLTEKGHQPMCDDSGQVALVYNGEVYNFASLRTELKALGHTFRSNTDTEVVLRAYLAWGIEAVGRLEGMFAMAIYDGRHQKCYLVRDRLGIKPLFYSLREGRLVFGSELRAVLAEGGVDRQLDPRAAWDFFTCGYVPTPSTIYKSVLKLPPAHILTLAGGQATLDLYWDVQFECLGDNVATARERLAELLDRAVDDYLVADVPTGTYLSGGIDSSVVTQRAAGVFSAASSDPHSRRLGGSNLHTFSIGFDVAEHSELRYARLAAAEYGTVHTELTVTREAAHEAMGAIVDLFDEPFAASSTIGMLSVARLARQKVTVALCGEGGDEVFGGYSWYQWWLRFQKPSFWRTAAGQVARRTFEAVTRHRKRKWRLAALESVDLYAQLMGAVTEDDKARIFSGDIAAEMAEMDPAAHFRRFWRDDLPPMARMQYVDMMTFLPDLNLTRADRTSMHFSLELRVPLLNHHLIEYVCGLRQDIRNPAGEMKGLFRRAMWDRLPEPIRHRKKKGFSAPVRQWFTPEDLTALVRAVKAERAELARSWLHPELDRFARHLKGSRAYKLWVMLQWLRRHA